MEERFWRSRSKMDNVRQIDIEIHHVVMFLLLDSALIHS